MSSSRDGRFGGLDYADAGGVAVDWRFYGFQVTVSVYVLVEVPSCAVTKVVIVFAPTDSISGPEAVPDATVVPFTVMVAVASAVVGVTVMDVTPLTTLAE